MTNEEFDRRMAFIIEQQAQFTANDLKHRAWQEDMEERFARITQSLAEANDVVTRLARVTNEGFKDVSVKINALVDAQIRMEEQQHKTDEQLRKTDEILRRHLRANGHGRE